TEPVYPMPINFNSGVNLFHPDYQTPFSRSYSIGFQRALTRQGAVEIRYVGAGLVDGSATEEWNEVNFTTNGFLDEFKLAQQNLQAAIARGCGAAGQPGCPVADLRPGTRTDPP